MSRVGGITMAEFEIPRAVAITKGPGGLPQVNVTTPAANATVFLHGSHVARFKPADSEEVLFLSRESNFQTGKAIRGGVPVIFPWFGPNREHRNAPSHGVARTVTWELEKVDQSATGEILLRLRLESGAFIHPAWPHPFAAWFSISIAKTLQMTLEYENRSTEAIRYEDALHSYFAVSDVRKIAITGLEGTEYLDQTDGNRRKAQGNTPITFPGETDRIYLDTTASCEIEDPGAGRRITIGKSGSRSTVVWNPWIRKAEALADFGNDEWPGMVCVETCNAAENLLTLEPGARHATTASVQVTDLQSSAV